MTIKTTPIRPVTERDYSRESQMLDRLEELKEQYAIMRGWYVDEDGEPDLYWWENDEREYEAECYAYGILAKEFPET